MNNLTPQLRIANTAAVLAGPYGTVTKQAALSGTSRQSLYRAAPHVLQAVAGADAQRRRDALQEKIDRARADGANLRRQLQHAVVFDRDRLACFAATAQAEGISLPGDGETYNDPDMTWQKWSWVGAQSTHGCLIEVASPYESRNDGDWHHAPNKFAYKGPGEHPSHAETVPIMAG